MRRPSFHSIGQRTSLSATLMVWLLSIAVLAGPPQNPARRSLGEVGGRQAPVDFTTQIRPLLSDRCFRCHGPDAGKRKRELRLDLPEGTFKTLDGGWAVVKPGRPEQSELVRRIYDEGDDLMPPPESNLSLSDAEKALLRRWVEEGADYRPHWAFQPVRSRPYPGPAAGASTNPIDGFIATRLAAAGLRPSPAA